MSIEIDKNGNYRRKADPTFTLSEKQKSKLIANKTIGANISTTEGKKNKNRLLWQSCQVIDNQWRQRQRDHHHRKGNKTN